MREIKFKAKRIDNGEWVEGDLIHDFRGDIISIRYLGTSCNCITFEDIDPETLCQFTELYDKNGKEIWEGDIVVNAFGEKYVVELGFDDGEHCPMSKLQIPNKNFREVIGNKFDNPELLEGENE